MIDEKLSEVFFSFLFMPKSLFIDAARAPTACSAHRNSGESGQKRKETLLIVFSVI